MEAAGGLAVGRLKFAGRSGYARFREWRNGGLGAILRLQRVRPRSPGSFQPLRETEVTPRFLDRTVAAIKRWKYDIIPVGEISGRLADPRARRFVCLTFDGGSRDIPAYAWPVLQKHAVPFAVYLPTATVDGVGCAWREALAQVISAHGRINLLIDRTERRFKTDSVADRYESYRYLAHWLRGLPPAERLAAISDLCKRYGVDLGQVSRALAMTWDDIEKLAGDPLVTIGSATVNGSLLAGLSSGDAQREMQMGRAVAEAAVRRTLPHFAYPDGASDTFGRREIMLAGELGFETAVTAIPGTFRRNTPADLLALPRITVDGRVTSRPVLRALLAGLS